MRSRDGSVLGLLASAEFQEHASNGAAADRRARDHGSLLNSGEPVVLLGFVEAYEQFRQFTVDRVQLPERRVTKIRDWSPMARREPGNSTGR